MNGQHVVLNIRDCFVKISTLFSFTRAARCGTVTIEYTVARMACLQDVSHLMLTQMCTCQNSRDFDQKKKKVVKTGREGMFQFSQFLTYYYNRLLWCKEAMLFLARSEHYYSDPLKFTAAIPLVEQIRTNVVEQRAVFIYEGRTESHEQQFFVK